MRSIWKSLFVVTLFTAACSGGNTGPTFDVADQDKIKAVIQQLKEVVARHEPLAPAVPT